MKETALKNMLKEYYDVEITKVVMIISFAHIPELIRPFLGIIIDAKLIQKRKYYLVFFAFTVTLLETLIYSYWVKDVNRLAWILFIDNFSQWFLDAAITSIIVQ